MTYHDALYNRFHYDFTVTVSVEYATEETKNNSEWNRAINWNHPKLVSNFSLISTDPGLVNFPDDLWQFTLRKRIAPNKYAFVGRYTLNQVVDMTIKSIRRNAKVAEINNQILKNVFAGKDIIDMQLMPEGLQLKPIHLEVELAVKYIVSDAIPRMDNEKRTAYLSIVEMLFVHRAFIFPPCQEGLNIEADYLYRLAIDGLEESNYICDLSELIGDHCEKKRWDTILQLISRYLKEGDGLVDIMQDTDMLDTCSTVLLAALKRIVTGKQIGRAHV